MSHSKPYRFTEEEKKILASADDLRKKAYNQDVATLYDTCETVMIRWDNKHRSGNGMFKNMPSYMSVEVPAEKVRNLVMEQLGLTSSE